MMSPLLLAIFSSLVATFEPACCDLQAIGFLHRLGPARAAVKALCGGFNCRVTPAT